MGGEDTYKLKWQDACAAVGVILAVAGMDIPIYLRLVCFLVCAISLNLCFLCHKNWWPLVRWTATLIADGVLLCASFYAWKGSHPKIAKYVYLVWRQPAPMNFGEVLTDRQLNATAKSDGMEVQGTYVYSPTFSSNLPVGMDTLTVDFIPRDMAAYRPAKETIAVLVRDRPSNNVVERTPTGSRSIPQSTPNTNIRSRLANPLLASPSPSTQPQTNAPIPAVQPCVPSPGGNSFSNIRASGGLYGVIEAGRGDCWNGIEAKGSMAGILNAPNGYIPGITPPSTQLSFSVKNKREPDGSQKTTVEIIPIREIEDPFILIYFSNPVTGLMTGSLKMSDGERSIVEQSHIELERMNLNDAPNSPDDPNLLGLKFMQPKKLTTRTKISLTALLSSQGIGVTRVCLIANDLKSCT